MIIPDSTTFDQRTMTSVLEHDPVVQRYQAFFALFDWSVVPDPAIDPSRLGKGPHPQSAYLKALLLKREEGMSTCTQLSLRQISFPFLQHSHAIAHHSCFFLPWSVLCFF